MNIFEAVEFGKNQLFEKNIANPKNETEKIIEHILEVDKIFILLNQNLEISKNQLLKLKSFISRRGSGEPLEYILEKVSFYSEQFFIKKGALIPRPETEILIDKAIEILKGFKNSKVLEIGVGSGVVSIMLAKLVPNISIVAIDISEKALKIAQQNIRLFQVADKIELIQSDLFEKVDNLNKFDLIISNPPYISKSEKGKLQKELDFEPEIALYGGTIGDEILQKLVVNFFKNHNIKYLVCEMGYDQKQMIEDFVKNRGKLDFYQDLANFDRGFILEKHLN